MASSGNVHTVTFTPEFEGQLTLTAAFHFEGDFDLGDAVEIKLFKTQSAVTVDGTLRRLGSLNRDYVIRYIFPITSLASVTCGLFADIDGAGGCEFTNVYITAQLVAAAS